MPDTFDLLGFLVFVWCGFAALWGGAQRFRRGTISKSSVEHVFALSWVNQLNALRGYPGQQVLTSTQVRALGVLLTWRSGCWP